MENRKENIDELFNEKLQNLGQDTPYDAWEAINSRLDNAKRRRRLILMRWVGVLLLLFASFFSGFYYNNWTSDPENNSMEPSIALDSNPDSDDGQEQKENKAKNTVVPSQAISSQTPEDAHESTLDERSSQEMTKSSSSDAIVSSPPKAELSDKTSTTSEPEIIVLHTKDKEQEQITLSELHAKIVNEKIAIQENDLLLFKPNNLSRSLFGNNSSRKTFPKTWIGNNFLSNVEVSGIGGVSFPFRTVNYDASDPIIENNVNNERLQNTYTYGLRLSKRWKNLDYNVGVFYSTWKQTSNNIILEGDLVNNSLQAYTDMVAGITSIGNISFGVATGPPIQPALENGRFFLVPNISQEYQFIDIPIGVSYYFIDKKFQLKFLFALNNKILSGSMVEFDFPNGVKEDYQGLVPNSFSLQLSAGPGFAYKLSNRFKLLVEPTVYYGLSPISNSHGVKTYLHQFSVLGGLSYSL